MKERPVTQIITGLLAITVGVGFLLHSLNISSFSTLIATWWPLAIIVLGFLNLAIHPRQFIWPAVMIVSGVLLQLRSLDIVNFHIWNILWPLLIIAFGLSLLSGRSLPRTKTVQEDHIDSFVVFSGTKARNQSKDFQGGQLTAWFGGIELDLRDADIKDRARLDITAAFGGVEIKVPHHWIVVTSGLPLFGGWEDKTNKPNADKKPVLEVNGTCLFGGFEIKN